MAKYNANIKKICLTALFVAIGIVLPYFTMNIKAFGKMLLPMHYPVMLCGLICGESYGLFVGLLLPILRYFIVGTPIIYPTALAMCIELAVYGFAIGFLYNRSKYKCIIALYRCLIITMVLGRVLWGITYYILLRFIGQQFTAYMFLTSAFISGIPGIIGQLIIIPIIAIAINKTKLINLFDKRVLSTQ